MIKYFIFVIAITIFFSCKKSETPNPSNTTDTTGNNTTTDQPPVLQPNLSYTDTSATKLQIDLSDKITTFNGNSWSITDAVSSHGTTSISGKIIEYTPNTGYTGTDTISVTITDSKGATSTGKISVSISNNTPTNNSPIFTETVKEVVSDGSAQTFTLPVSDADNNTVTITSITGASNNVSVSYSGLNITVTPSTATYAGSENLSITITDGIESTTSNFILNVGKKAQQDTYEMMKPFLNRSCQTVNIAGSVTLTEGTIITTMAQHSSGFFSTTATAGTYTYKILNNGYVEFTAGAVKTLYSVEVKYDKLILTKDTTGVEYVIY